jgi:hypothetical protein
MAKPRQTAKGKTCVIYVRTSSATNAGEDKDSELRQIARCRAFAASKEWRVMNVFRDPAVSDPWQPETPPCS